MREGMEGWGKGCGLIRLYKSEVEGGLMHQEAFNLNTHPCQILIVVLKSHANLVMALLHVPAWCSE